MPAARISMRAIHHKRAFDKSLVLGNFAEALLLRGFRLEHPDTIELRRSEREDPWMHVEQAEPPGRVPSFDATLQGFLVQLHGVYNRLQLLFEEGDLRGEAGLLANRGIQMAGSLRDWLARQGDDRAEMMGRLTGESGAAGMTGWSDDAGAQAELIKGCLLLMGGLREDIK